MEPLDSEPSQYLTRFSIAGPGFILMATNDHLRGHTLGSTMLRVGILAVLRSKKLDGRTIGVMITASHNPAEVSILSSCPSSHILSMVHTS